jgi:23S rRNA pseudouridine1911/1915/1917 synthase
VQKIYRAIVEGKLEQPQGEFVDWLLKNHETNIVRSVPSQTPSARHCCLRFRSLQSCDGLTKLEITPETGRSHQIRVQLAVRGHPICGDGKYGSKRALHGAIALHASELTFDHPIRHEPITVTAPEPANWDTLFPSLRKDRGLSAGQIEN